MMKGKPLSFSTEALGFNAIFAILLLSGLLSNLTPTEALRHSFYTRRDRRSLIGPLGYPFGFLDKGHYNMTVFDFQLSAPKKAHSHNGGDNLRLLEGTETQNKVSEVLDNIRGVGFLLKKFKDEAHFYGFMNFYRENPGECIFENYFSVTDDNYDQHYQDVDDFTYAYDDLPYDDYVSWDDYFLGDNDDFLRRSLHQHPSRRLNTGGIQLEDGSIFLDMLPRSNWGENTPWVAYEFAEGEGGFYFLIYQVCYNIPEDYSGNIWTDDRYHIHSRFGLDFHFSNTDMFGRTSYLSSGEMILPWLFFLFSILYAVCFYVWYGHIKLIRDGKEGYLDSGDPPVQARPGVPASTATIYPIHHLMSFLLGLKFCSLLFESIRYHYLRVMGHAVFFSAVYYAFAFLKGITLFTVILLIGSGWSFVKPFLSEREKKMIFGILVLQVINNIAIVVLTQETEGEVAFDRWTALLHLVDILCCCAVLIPIVWQVNQLEKNIEQNQHKGKDDGDGGEEESFIGDDRIPEDELEDVPMSNGVDGDEDEPITDARMAAKLKTFRTFYLMVIAYVYMTRIVVYLFEATLNYKHTWMRVFVTELTTIIFYTSVGYMFRPINESLYTAIGKRRRDDEEGQVELRRIDPSTKTALD